MEEHLEDNFALYVPDEEELVLVSKIDFMIKEVRAIVNIFNKSPQKNDILQRYVVLENKKELALLRDFKTRWNSMLSMIERFLLLRRAISKALVDLSGEMNINEAEFNLFEDLKCALEPLRVGVEPCAEKILPFLLQILLFALFLLNALEVVQKRVSERRICNIVSLLRYLDNAKNRKKKFQMASKKAMIRTAKSLSRLFQTSAEEEKKKIKKRKKEVVDDNVPLDDDENQQLKLMMMRTN